MKVFWSWQSDTPGKIGRHFVRDALDAAVEQLKQTADIDEPIDRETRSALHLDQDRKGISGSPDLARVILEKIEQASVFVGDVTPVGTVPGHEAGTVAKKIMNPNVAIELGYALHALSDRALLMVMNEHYGSRDDLPFDLRSKAGPLMFRLAPNADRPTRTAEARQLTARFIEALNLFIDQHVESVRQERPFPEGQAQDGPARFRAPGKALGMRDGVGLLDASAGNDIFLAPGPAMWLRLMPAFDPGKKWKSHELRSALNQGINLPTLIGPAEGMHAIRAADGVGTCIVHRPEEHETEFVTFVFETGEIWAVSTYPVRNIREMHVIFADEVERMLKKELPVYAQFLSKLGVRPPYRWIAGLTGVKDRELQYPPAPGTIRIDWGNCKCVSEHIISEGLYDMLQTPTNALLPFFNEIYDKCGIERSVRLPR